MGGGGWRQAPPSQTDVSPLLAIELMGFGEAPHRLGVPSPEEFLFQLGRGREKRAGRGDPRPRRSRRAQKHHPPPGTRRVTEPSPERMEEAEEERPRPGGTTRAGGGVKRRGGSNSSPPCWAQQRGGACNASPPMDGWCCRWNPHSRLGPPGFRATGTPSFHPPGFSEAAEFLTELQERRRRRRLLHS